MLKQVRRVGPWDSLAEHVAYNVRFPLALIREGWNEIVVENGGPQTLTVVGLEVGIRPVERVGV